MSEEETEVIEKRYSILKSIFSDIEINYNKKEVSVFCPKHEHRKRKLSINVSKNKFQCWVCGYSGGIKKLLAEYARPESKKEYLYTLGVKYETNDKEEKIELPKEYRFLLSSVGPCSDIAKNYARNNLRFSNKSILQNKIGLCEDGLFAGRLIFPSFDRKGEINYFTTRRFDGGTYKKYLNCEKSKSSIIFNEIFINWKNPLILVEGVKSHIKHFSVGNVVPILGSSLSENSRLFEEIILNDCKEVYVFLDPDAKSKAVDMCSKLAKNGLQTYICNSTEQPDELSSKDFIKCIESASKVSMNDIFTQKIMMA